MTASVSPPPDVAERRTRAAPRPGVRRSRGFPVFRQMDAMDCGPTCIRMIAKHHGRLYSLPYLREKSYANRQGVSMRGLAYAAESVGFRTLAAKVDLEQLAREAPLPCVVHWEQEHFVVVYRVARGRVHVADPARGLVSYTADEFVRGWASIAGGERPRGAVLLLEPTPAFYEREGDAEGERTRWRFLLSYVRGYGPFLAQAGVGMLVASLLQLVFPFLTQAIVDHGIGHRDVGLVNLILIAQLTLFVSRTAVEAIRNRILFHVGSRVYVSIVADFLAKLTRLPIAFFDTRMVGDVLQRVHDHQRIQQFLTTTTFHVAFSALTLLVFGAVLAAYSPAIFAVFAAGSAAYLAYVAVFLRRRRELDHLRFAEQARNQSALVEMVMAMPDIKLANAEQAKRWGWERSQARLFRVDLRALGLDQLQDGGATFINELKNIAVTFLAVRLVTGGEMTLGMLLAVQYILGQLNGPLSQLIAFAHAAQDAQISLERLAEMHAREDEERPDVARHALPAGRSLELRGVTFRYGSPHSAPVLDDVVLTIPEGGVTAIVGPSGSGKTTLLKLLLKFHEPSAGELRVGAANLREVSHRAWRERCGVVMQDGQLFSDTILGNIAVGEERVDFERLAHAADVANIREFVETRPAGYQTKVGRDGLGMSEGQRQRLLIARAVYKDPDYLFFDEATSALDAANERTIIENLQDFCRGRTVVVVAHRLSTVRHADQIVVLDRGRVVERGTHAELTALRGSYYHLVKNQLELGV
jgi:ATP-binding cassette, subfamily B, bacterial